MPSFRIMHTYMFIATLAGSMAAFFHKSYLQGIVPYIQYTYPIPVQISDNATFYRQDSSSVLSRSVSPHSLSRPFTKILAFADYRFRNVSQHWYNRLSELGYDTHTIVATDNETLNYFLDLNERRNGENDLFYRVEHIGGPDCSMESFSNRNQIYRRRIFASRWTYILRHLQNDTHILITDADNQFHRMLPMSELESSPYDIYHAFESGLPSYPSHVFRRWGFTVCGGMGWLRAAPSVVAMVKELVKRCNCEVQTCSCQCDDQLELNSLQLQNKIQWNQPAFRNESASGISWDSLTGICNTTGNRIKVWDRHTAFRGVIPSNRSECPHNSWVTMPKIPQGFVKDDLIPLWNAVCGEG